MPSQAFAKTDIKKLSIKEISYKALEYALSTQVQVDGKYYIKGEFPTQIESSLVPVLVGVGKPIVKDQEATPFTTASVVNILSQIYLDNSELKNEGPLSQIPAAISSAVKTFSRYETDSTFNFYPSLKVGDKTVHRPIDMTLLPIWHGFTNIPNDADSSSVALAALVFNSKINNVAYEVPQQALDTLSKYRDNQRKPMFYNKREDVKNTGAFMTWLFDENSPDMPHFWFAKSTKGTRIPFNRNDVDCIVNGNVLKMLSLAKRTDVAGHEQACSLLNEMISEDAHATCGVYYPNTLNLSFTAATIEKAGESCITESSQSKIVQKIISLQTEDGSWVNEGNTWADPTLSTAFAMYSLLHFADLKEQKVQSALIFGTHYLLANVKEKDGQLYWPADHYFTATAIARSLIMWSSKAYTNAIIASVLLEMNKKFPSYKVENYMIK